MHTECIMCTTDLSKTNMALLIVPLLSERCLCNNLQKSGIFFSTAGDSNNDRRIVIQLLTPQGDIVEVL